MVVCARSTRYRKNRSPFLQSPPHFNGRRLRHSHCLPGGSEKLRHAWFDRFPLFVRFRSVALPAHQGSPSVFLRERNQIGGNRVSECPSSSAAVIGASPSGAAFSLRRAATPASRNKSDAIARSTQRQSGAMTLKAPRAALQEGGMSRMGRSPPSKEGPSTRMDSSFSSYTHLRIEAWPGSTPVFPHHGQPGEEVPRTRAMARPSLNRRQQRKRRRE